MDVETQDATLRIKFYQRFSEVNKITWYWSCSDSSVSKPLIDGSSNPINLTNPNCLCNFMFTNYSKKYSRQNLSSLSIEVYHPFFYFYAINTSLNEDYTSCYLNKSKNITKSLEYHYPWKAIFTSPGSRWLYTEIKGSRG